MLDGSGRGAAFVTFIPCVMVAAASLEYVLGQRLGVYASVFDSCFEGGGCFSVSGGRGQGGSAGWLQSVGCVWQLGFFF